MHSKHQFFNVGKRRAFAHASLAAGLSLLASLPVRAADLEDPPAIAAAPALAPAYSGPLATFAAQMAVDGVTFHATALDFSAVNPSLGLQPGRAANSLYLIEGADFDLGRIAGIQGAYLHFENMFFPATENLNIAPQIGDSQVGYQPPYTPKGARLSKATLEVKALDDSLDLEGGLTHPGYYYAAFNCGSINTCFQEMLYLNAGYTSYAFAVPGGNIRYNISPRIYVEGGVFATQQNANAYTGYDFSAEKFNGTLGIGEIGYKSDLGMDTYPMTASLTGFANSTAHSDYTFQAAFTGAAAVTSGTSGIVVQAEKIVWRQDGGRDVSDKHPTAIKIYGSFGTAFDSTMPLQQDAWIGATLMAPFAGHPNDTFGVKIDWQRLGDAYAGYLTAANFVAGGPGWLSPYKRDSYIFEANAHLQLPYGMAFEPVIQYEINPNSYFNPMTPLRARDGVYLGGTYVIPLGTMLGLQASN